MTNFYTSVRKLMLSAALLFMGSSAFAQLPMTRSAFVGTYTAISTGTGATASTAAGDDGTQTLVPLGFSFNYLGTSYNSVTLSTNGWLSFNNTTSTSFSNGDMYSTSGPNNAVFPWFDDLTFSVNPVSGVPSLLYQTQGTVGSQTFTAQWTNVCAYRTAGGTALNFQVILYETSNLIEFRYGTKTVGTYLTGQSASIGIEGLTGGNGNYLDAMTGSSKTGHYYLSESQWPNYFFRFTPGAPAALAGGTYSVGIGQTYSNLTEAVCDINQRGISGAVTLNLTDAVYDTSIAGGSNFFPILLGPVTGSSSTNTITISKSGSASAIRWGGNIGGSTAGSMVNQASTAINSSNVEPIFALVGADYVTLNNVDIRGNVGFQNADHGIGIYNSSATDGAQNNTFSNFTVIMRRANTGTRGIVQNVVTAPTAATGANSANIFKDFSITNTYAGIQLIGNASFPDLSTQVIRTTCGTFNTIGDPATANDIGNGTSATFGISLTNQSGFTVSGNSIRNVSGSAAQTDGIVVVTFVGTCSINNNKIQTIRNISTSSTTGIAGIRMSHTTSGTHNIRVYNNSVSEITSAYTGAASTARTLKGIFVNGTGGATTQVYDIYNNSVSIDGSASPNLSSACYEVNTTSGPVFNVVNNIFANYTAAQGATAKHYAYVTTSATLVGNTGSISNNNDLYVANDIGTSGFVGLGNATNYNTLANWQAAMTGQDAASVSIDPLYVSTTSNLHATALGVNGAGTAPPVYITNDLDCSTRTPDNDLGAYILNACSGTPTAGSITGATSVCSGSGTTLTLTGASAGAGISYQWASSTTNGGPYTNLLGTSNTQATGNLTSTTYYVVATTCTVSGQSVVTAQYTVTVNPLPTIAVTPTTGVYCLPGGSPVSLTASGGTSYSWLPATGLSSTTIANPNATPSASTTYTVTGTGANGCLNTATATVNVSTALSVDSVRAVPASVCSGGNSTLTAYSHLLASAYCQPTYSTGTGFGDYVSLVTLNTLSNATGASASPYYTLYPASGSTTTTLVAGSTYTVTLSAGTYTSNDLAAWIDFNQNGILNDASEKLGETDNFGAGPATTSFIFTVPLTAMNGQTRFRVRDMDHGTTNDMDPCAAQSSFGETEDYVITITGGVNPVASYTWSPATFLSSTTTNPTNANAITATTTYTVTAVSSGGCSATGNVTITAGSPLSATASVVPSATVCSGTNVTITATPAGGGGPFTYSWSGPNSFTSTSQSPTITSATTAATGTYTCVITDNCAATFTVTTLLTVNLTPTVAATPSASTFCSAGSPVALTASGASTYAWSPASGLSATTGTTVNANPTSTTTYTITGTASNGCSSTATAAVTYAESPQMGSVTATPAQLCPGSSSQLNASAGTTSAYTASVGTFATQPCQSNAGPTGDDVVTQTNIGFTFNYFGRAYTQLGISTNGNVQLGDGTGSAGNPIYSNAWTDVAIPNAATPNNMIALCWDDWFINAGELTYGTTGTAPNRKMIICYNTTGRGSGSADTLVGQIVLEETTNKIYLNMTKKGVQAANTATQGIEDQNGTAASVGIVNRQAQAWSTNNNTVVFTPSGGSPAYSWTPSTFLSSTAIANPMANAVTAATTYTVTATTAAGCTATGSVAITLFTVPVVSISGTNSICAGDTATLTGSSGGTSQWYLNGSPIAGATSNTYLATVSGVYNMLKTNLNGCSDSSHTSFVLTVNALPTVTANASLTSVCFGNSTTLTGSGATTYSWSGSVTDGVAFNPASTATYTVTGTDGNGCSDIDSITVVVNSLPVVSLGADTTTCAMPVMLDAGNAGSSFMWNDNSTNQTLTAAATGTYAVVVTDGNGCTSNDSVNVTVNALPVVSLGADSATCGMPVMLDAGNAGSSFMWNDNSTSQTLTAAASGTYYVTVTDTNGCSAADSVNVTINAIPVVSLGADTATCATAVLLDAGNAGASYLWNDSSVNQTLSAAVSGTYYVTVTDTNGCSSADSVNVTVNTNPTVALGADSTLCGGPLVLDAGNAGSSYLWNDSTTNQTLSAAATGTYYVMVTDGNGCSGTDSINVTINAIPNVTFSISQSTICVTDASLTLSATPTGGTFSGNGVTGNTFNPSTLNGPETITYTYTDVNGCSASASDIVTVDSCVGIIEPGVVGNLSIFPNPNTGMFNIHFSVAPVNPVKAEITNSLGQLVQAFMITTDNQLVDLSNDEGGVYYLRLTTGTATAVYRVVKQ